MSNATLWKQEKSWTMIWRVMLFIASLIFVSNDMNAMQTSDGVSSGSFSESEDEYDTEEDKYEYHESSNRQEQIINSSELITEQKDSFYYEQFAYISQHSIIDSFTNVIKSPSCNMIAFVQEMKNNIIVWNMLTDKKISIKIQCTGMITTAAFSPLNNSIAVGTSYGEIIIVNLHDTVLFKDNNAGNKEYNTIKTLAFDGKVIVSASGKRLKVSTLSSKAFYEAFIKEDILQVMISKNDLLLIQSAHSLTVLNKETGKKLAYWEEQAKITAMTFDEQSNNLVYSTEDGTIIFWNFKSSNYDYYYITSNLYIDSIIMSKIFKDKIIIKGKVLDTQISRILILDSNTGEIRQSIAVQGNTEKILTNDTMFVDIPCQEKGIIHTWKACTRNITYADELVGPIQNQE